MATTTLLEISCRGPFMLNSSVTISAFIHKLCKWAHLYCWQFNQLVTNGLSNSYNLDESTFILGAAGVTFHFIFAFYYIYIGSGTARFITVETRMLPDCAGIAPTPSRWRHGCSRRLPGFITVFDSLPGYYRSVPVVLNILKQPGTWAGSTRFIPDLQGCPRCRHGCDTVHHGSFRIIKPGWTGTLNRYSENGA